MELKSRDVRRLALTASGLRRPRPKGPAGLGALRRVAGELGVLQIDSVNVLARAHYLPPWSRLGGYPRERLDALAYRDHVRPLLAANAPPAPDPLRQALATIIDHHVQDYIDRSRLRNAA